MTDSHEPLERVVREALSRRRSDHFPGDFADRLVARWTADRTRGGDVRVWIVNRFSRLAPLAAAAGLILALWNVRHRQDQTLVEALVGITPARQASSTPTLDSFYALGESGGN